MAQLFALLLVLLDVQPASKPPETPPLSLDARWSMTFETPPVANPGFDETSAYVPLQDQLVAVDLDRGTVRWRQAVATEFTPATGEGLVFIVSGTSIEARDGASGKTRWRADLPGGTSGPLYFDTGWLLASTPAGDLAAFRAADGTLVWRRELGAPLVGPPGPALDRLFLPLADNRLVAVMLVSGDTVWERKTTARITGMLALDEQIVFGTAAKDLISVDVRRGRERWSWRLGGDLAGIPSADDKRIYFASRDNLLRAVDRGSGNLRWKADLASRPAGGPLRLADALSMVSTDADEALKLTDAVVMPLVSREILGFDAETGRQAMAATAAGEIGLQPYVRRSARQTLPRMITVSREGELQGFGRRFEPVPQPLTVLPGLVSLP